MSENNNCNTTNVGWFLAGVGIGVAGAILYAPRSGSETRKVIVNRLVDGKGYLIDLGQDATNQVSKLVDQGKEAVLRQKENFVTAVDVGRRAVHEATRKH